MVMRLGYRLLADSVRNALTARALQDLEAEVGLTLFRVCQFGDHNHCRIQQATGGVIRTSINASQARFRELP